LLDVSRVAGDGHLHSHRAVDRLGRSDMMRTSSGAAISSRFSNPSTKTGAVDDPVHSRAAPEMVELFGVDSLPCQPRAPELPRTRVGAAAWLLRGMAPCQQDDLRQVENRETATINAA
jgi:hypothetical protein